MGKVELESIYHIRPDLVDHGAKSAHPGIREFTHHLSNLLAEARELVTGPVSELVTDVEETTASRYSDETNRILRVTANCEGGPVTFDIVVNLASSTIYTSPHK